MKVEFIPGYIDGVIVRSLSKQKDDRGWLIELFRKDTMGLIDFPSMAYASATEAAQTRGPHEHHTQSDYFCFIGPGDFQLTMYDNRPNSATYRYKQSICVGASNPTAICIPPGVVHKYMNIGTELGVVFNAPNALYAGVNRIGPVDEIRHEADPNSPFTD